MDGKVRSSYQATHLPMKKSSFNLAVLIVCLLAFLVVGGAVAVGVLGRLLITGQSAKQQVASGSGKGTLSQGLAGVGADGGGEGAGIVGGKDEISGGTISSGKSLSPEQKIPNSPPSK